MKWSSIKEGRECLDNEVGHNSLKGKKEEKNEWQECARVLERFFLVMWIVTGIVMTVFILYVIVDVNNKWESM